MENLTEEPDMEEDVFKTYVPTPIQKRIEASVTNNLGYYTRTRYFKNNACWCEDNEAIHNTSEGLQIHLAELDERVAPREVLRQIIRTYCALAVSIHKFRLSLSFPNLNARSEYVGPDRFGT
jgi:hypothetical protein